MPRPRLKSGCPRFREREDEFGSYAFGAYDAYIFAVCLDCFLDDCKAEAGTFFVFSPGQIAFIKAFPYFAKGVPGDADSVIFYRHIYFVAAFS